MYARDGESARETERERETNHFNSVVVVRGNISNSKLPALGLVVEVIDHLCDLKNNFT